MVLALILFFAGGGDLEELTRQYQFTWAEDASTGRHTLKSGLFSLVFIPGMQTVVLNGVVRVLPTAPWIEGGRVKLPPDLVAQIEGSCPRGGVPAFDLAKPAPLPLPLPRKLELPPRKRLAPCVIAIDAGHGGVHTGYRGHSGLLEKDINLDVARELERILTSWGVKVVMTRRDDSHFSRDIDEDLMSRVRIVNGARPDLFISIHTNGVDHPGPRGYEVWVPLPMDARGIASRDLAALIRGELSTAWDRGSEDRGTKDEHNLRVLRQTSCPASLVEMEFVSNPHAERLLGSHEHRVKVAQAIAEACAKWLQKRGK